MKEFLMQNFVYIVMIVIFLPDGIVKIIRAIKKKDSGSDKE